MKATLLDEPDHRLCGLPILLCRDRPKVLDVDPMLQASLRFGEDLERKEVTDAADRNAVDRHRSSRGVGYRIGRPGVGLLRGHGTG